MRLEARTTVSRTAPRWPRRFGAIVATLGICASTGRLGRRAWSARRIGCCSKAASARVFAWSETLTRATPLMLTGLAVAVAFRTRLFNIGAEGQLYLGALAAVAVGGQVDGAAAPWAASPPNGLLFG